MVEGECRGGCGSTHRRSVLPRPSRPSRWRGSVEHVLRFSCAGGCWGCHCYRQRCGERRCTGVGRGRQGGRAILRLARGGGGEGKGAASCASPCHASDVLEIRQRQRGGAAVCPQAEIRGVAIRQIHRRHVRLGAGGVRPELERSNRSPRQGRLVKPYF